MKVTAFVFFAEGFEEIEAITIVDILRRAEIDTQMISITGNKTVVGAHGVPVITDSLFEEIQEISADALILPGGIPGSTNLANHEALGTLLTKHASQKKLTAAICAAPIVLGKFGILQNNQATCYPGYENFLTGADVKKESVIVSNHIITGNGPGATAKFAFRIVEILKSKEIADKWKNGMMYT